MDVRSREDVRSVPALLRELRDETTALLRQEVALARTEMTEKTSRIGRNVGYLSFGGAILFAGFLYLLWAAMEGVRIGLVAMNPDLARHTAWLGPLIVGGLVLLVGLILISKALKTLKRTSVVPEKTVQTLKEDKEWLQRKAA